MLTLKTGKMNTFISRTGNKSPVQVTIFTALIFFIFTMGYIGILIPETRAISVRVTPYIIMLSLLSVLYFVKPYTFKKVLIFLIIAVFGFFIEFIGKTLGLSLFNTPLLIGINWLFLVYASASVMERYTLNSKLKILLASLIMLAYDVVLEPVAMKTDMWYWMNSIIPLQNYIAWFVIAIILHSFLRWSRIDTKNPVAPWVLLCQFLFFLALRIFLK
jgi:putative membrane protein